MDPTPAQIKHTFSHILHDDKKDVTHYMTTVYLFETAAATYSSFGNIVVLKLKFIVIWSC